MVSQGSAGEQAAAEAGARLLAQGFELRRLLRPQQLHRVHVPAARDRLVTQWQREVGQGAAVGLGELDPLAHLGGVQRHGRHRLRLAQAEVVVAGRRRQGDRRLALQDRGVVHQDLDVEPGDQHRVAVQVVDHRVQREALVVLDDAETEAVPLQRVRRRQDVLFPLRLRHLTVLLGDELDVARVLDGVPDDVLGPVVLEPAVVGRVATKVRVDDVGHRADVATAGNVPGAHDGPRVVEPLLLELHVAAKVADLHRARRHLADRRLPGLRERTRRWLPRHD